MKCKSHSIRTFIGAKDFEISKAFYHQLGFEEINLGPKMSYFKVNNDLGFYLQDYYAKEWVNNSMVFLEVDNVEECQKELLEMNLPEKYKNVRLTKIKNENWGRELFLHDPSGILWHFGEFKKETS